MTDQGTSRNIRRNTQRGPSPIRHGIIAFLLAFTVLMSGYLGLKILITNGSAPKQNKVTLSTSNPQPDDPVETLNTQPELRETELPDLLGASVPEDSNPTDALAGAEIANAPKQDEPETATPQGNIRINGQPAGRDTATPLLKAPIQGLSRQSPYGNIPDIAENGDTAFLRYAKPFQTPVNAKSVAIIIGGLGLNAEITTRAILDLPEEVTLSFAAHSPQLQNWIDQARENGHEVLLELPMEANNASTNPVNRTLIVSDDIAQNTRHLDWLLSRGTGYFAVTNYNGDKFMTRSDVVAPVMSYLNDAGLGLIFDGSFPAVALPALATSAKLPFIEAEMVLDEVDNRDLTENSLNQLGEKALAGSHPIGVGFGYRSTIEAVAKWSKDAPESGLVLVPASHLMTP